MSSNTYKIVSGGQIGQDFSEAQVIQNLQHIFNIDQTRAAGLFAQPDTVIKSGLSLIHAERYRDRLTEAGLQVAIYADSNPSSTAPDTIVENNTETQPEAPAENASGDPAAASMSRSGLRRVQIDFTGSGREYFGIWIVNILLCILTLGLYSAWATVRDKQYFYGNTKIEGSGFQYLANPWVILRGRLIAGAAVVVWVVASELWLEAAAALAIAFLFMLPWIVTRGLKFTAINSAYRNIRFDFNASYGQAFMALLIWPFVGLITLFLAMPFAAFKSQQFLVENSSFGTTQFKFTATPRQYYAFFLKLLGIALGTGLLSLGVAEIANPALAFPVAALGYLILLGYLLAALTNLAMDATTLAEHGFASKLGKRQTVWIYLTNSLLIGLTLGFFTPWAKVRMARYRASCTEMLIDGELDQFVAAEHTRTSAIGQEMADAFDVGFAPI